MMLVGGLRCRVCELCVRGKDWKWAGMLLIRKCTRVDPENQNTGHLFLSALLFARLQATFAKWKSTLKTSANFDQSDFRIKRVLHVNLENKKKAALQRSIIAMQSNDS
jgi:hypothetical protein